MGRRSRKAIFVLIFIDDAPWKNDTHGGTDRVVSRLVVTCVPRLPRGRSLWRRWPRE
jgi:hypothetical protein